MVARLPGEGKSTMANVLPFEARVRIASALVEGVSIRGTERLTGVTKKTVQKFGVDLGEGCRRLHDRLVRGLSSSLIECDEIFGYVAKKEHRVDREKDPEEWGDAYTWVALDANSKLAIAYLTGKRDGAAAKSFMLDVRSRLLCRAQITSDGLGVYVEAVEGAFSRYGVDFGQVVKQYRGGDQRVDRRYEPARETHFIQKTAVFGDPREDKMSTSFVERQNLTMRMHMRRLTRLTNAFSKKIDNLSAAVALHFMWYNFCRMHETIRCTPAMASGLTDHVWDMPELVAAALAEPAAKPVPLAPMPTPPGGPISEGVQLDLFGIAFDPVVTRPALRLIKGGKASAVEETEEEAPDTVRGMGWGLLEGGSEGLG